ncbi:hypothetical protein V6N12_055817 [Hibiscus sabdariffa]|uniref:RNase H type-1 domain-containing protein n=1 Tax=Hibiscus sabdariffa TaxID=183260 RepID=A0ABR2AVT4_9ROSI
MSSGFKWSIEHVERIANDTADKLAKSAQRSREVSRWLALQFLKWKGCVLTMRCGYARSTLLCEKVVDG